MQKAFNCQKASKCLESNIETGKTNGFESLSLNHSRTSGNADSNPSGSKTSRKEKLQESQLLSVNDGNSIATIGKSTNTFCCRSNFIFDNDDDDDDKLLQRICNERSGDTLDNGVGNFFVRGKMAESTPAASGGEPSLLDQNNI